MEDKTGLEIGKEVQVKSGLEIHQQLDTHKLFCSCPSVLRKDEPEFEVKRKLHAVKGETGEIDVAAKYEAEKEREFIYQGYDTTCLVELDEEPPHEINQEALEIGLHVSLLLNCEILPITQIMRKTVVDGSNTSGFQRTVLIARNGYIQTKYGKVRIENVSLEEDSARAISREEGKVVYRLDRLGIPLVEIGTAPDIKSPEQAKEVAMYIGDVLRSCKVKRGIGTIRQDVNISIEGHPRVEIKGFQEPKMFIDVIENEIKRQIENIKKNKGKSEVRKANPDGTTNFLRPMPGSARMYPETDLPLLRITKKIIDNAKKTLPKSREEIRKELKQKGLRLEQIKILTNSGKLQEFESLLKIVNDVQFIFKVLIELPKQVSAHYNKPLEFFNEDIIERIVKEVEKGNLEKSDVKSVLEKFAQGENIESAVKIEKVDLSDLESEIAKIIKEKPGLSIGGYMGLIMAKFKGKVNGKEANEILKKLLG